VPVGLVRDNGSGSCTAIPSRFSRPVLHTSRMKQAWGWPFQFRAQIWMPWGGQRLIWAESPRHPGGGVYTDLSDALMNKSRQPDGTCHASFQLSFLSTTTRIFAKVVAQTCIGEPQRRPASLTVQRAGIIDREFWPAFVLCDYHMPGLDWLGVLQGFKRWMASIPVDHPEGQGDISTRQRHAPRFA